MRLFVFQLPFTIIENSDNTVIHQESSSSPTTARSVLLFMNYWRLNEAVSTERTSGSSGLLSAPNRFLTLFVLSTKSMDVSSGNILCSLEYRICLLPGFCQLPREQ